MNISYFQKSFFVGIIGIALLISGCSSSAKTTAEKEGEEASDSEMDMVNIPLETASDGDLRSLGSSTISWPGEIISYSDVQITPSREGKISSILVKIGDIVKKGQVIARLSPPQASMELTALLAEKKAALVNAQAQATSTQKLVAEAKKRLQEREKALIRTRDASLDVVEKEALQSVSSVGGASKELDALKAGREAKINTSNSELEQVQAILPVRMSSARGALKTLIQRFSSALSYNGFSPETPEQMTQFSIYESFGTQNTRTEYTKKLLQILTSLKNPDLLPEKEVNEYLTAASQLISNTGSSLQVPVTDLKNIRNSFFEDQQTYFDAVKEYQEAKIDVDVKKNKLQKIISESDREIVIAETNLSLSETSLDTIESVKKRQIAETDQEYTREKTDLEVKIAELNRQQELAEAEVKASVAAYSMVQSGLGGDIRAPENGIVSGIFKKVGDYVTVETAIASTSSNKNQDRFIRFRIPSDMRLPEKGEELTVERPGFPMTPEKATVIGIGLSLDENGSYQADAKFSRMISWPVNASVRVIPSIQKKSILIPLSAVWWSEEEKSYLWAVDENNMIYPKAITLGKAFGDRIEVEEGFEAGERFIPSPTMDIEESQMVLEGSDIVPTEHNAHEDHEM